MADSQARDTPLGKRIYRKTVAGTNEVIHREATDLPQRVRTLLVMVDGKATVEALVTRLAGLQVTEASFQLLIDRKLVELAGARSNTAGIAPAPNSRSPSQAPVSVTPTNPVSTSRKPSATTPNSAGTSSKSGTTASQPVSDGLSPADALEKQKNDLYELFTHTIRELLGFRGVMLTLAVEKADSLDDYRAIRDRFIAALEKSKGPEIARAMSERIGTLLD